MTASSVFQHRSVPSHVRNGLARKGCRGTGEGTTTRIKQRTSTAAELPVSTIFLGRIYQFAMHILFSFVRARVDSVPAPVA
jgi:hypothetical protein